MREAKIVELKLMVLDIIDNHTQRLRLLFKEDPSNPNAQNKCELLISLCNSMITFNKMHDAYEEIESMMHEVHDNLFVMPKSNAYLDMCKSIERFSKKKRKELTTS